MLLIQTFLFFIRRFRLLALLAVVALVALACTQEAVTAANAQTARVTAEAREHLEQVEEFLDEAEVKAEAAGVVAAELGGFRDAYKAEEYSVAVGHLRAALVEARKGGVDVPPDVERHLAEANALLTLVGQ